MATTYGTLERVKEQLDKASADTAYDTRLNRILADTADYINLKLKNRGIADPATSVTADRTIHRIASTLVAGLFLDERFHTARAGVQGLRGQTAVMKLKRAEMELDLWINTIVTGGGRVSEAGFQIERVDGKGDLGKETLPI